MAIAKTTLSVTTMPSTGRTWWGKKRKPTLCVIDSNTTNIVIGNKLLQNKPNLGKSASTRYSLLHVKDQDGNVGYVKASKDKLLEIEGLKREKLHGDATTYIKKKLSEPEAFEISDKKASFNKAMGEHGKKKIAELKRLGKAGYTPALHQLGIHYAESNPRASLNYFKRAANLGYPPSKLELSRKLFEKGKVSEGNNWVFRAARDEELGALLDIALGKASNIDERSKLDAKGDAISFLKKIQEEGDLETLSTYLDILINSLENASEDVKETAQDIIDQIKPKVPKKPKKAPKVPPKDARPHRELSRDQVKPKVPKKGKNVPQPPPKGARPPLKVLKMQKGI